MLAPPFSDALFEQLLQLNNDHAEELSYKTADGLRELFEAASHVRAEASGLALIVAFDQGCTYDNPNFAWFKARFETFYYVDRVVVGAAARGRGIARRLYADLATRAQAEDCERLACEINASPPNPASDSFHQAMGFEPVGEQTLAVSGKVVRYWTKALSRATPSAA